MPNMIAYGALLAWPVISLGLFMFMSAGRATIWTILAGYLLLPVSANFDFPGVPAFDKSSIPSLTALCLAPVLARSGEFRWPRSTAVNLLMLAYILVPFATSFGNGEVIRIGTAMLPAMGMRESLSSAIANFIELAPFILGAGLLGNARGHRDILTAFVIGALGYSVLILLEVRLSPFLQGRVYGLTDATYFFQQMRYGGFRAMVFMGHGLLVSTFCAMALVAAIGLWRARIQLFAVPMSLIAAYLAFILVVNKSLGAVLLVAVLAPLFVFLRPRRFLFLAAILGAMIVTYPMLRGSDLLPLKGINDMIGTVSPERSASLQYRLNNETILLNRAQQKPWFGWGTHGRNRVIVMTDWGAIDDLAVTDGTWIIKVGMFGWVGYIACFGLLAYPFWRGFKLRRAHVPVITVALLAMHQLNMLDLIPNSSLRPSSWLVAGALAGMTAASIAGPRRRRANDAEESPTPPPAQAIAAG